MNKDVSYRSARLLLRGIRREDAAKIVHWRSDPDNYRTFFDARPITMEEHLTWFERYLVDDARYDFMIFNEDGQPIGTAGLSSITDDSCEVSYMIGEKAERGKGYATEAVRLLTDVALRELGVKRVVARVRPENEASARVVIGGGYVESERIFTFEASGDFPLEQRQHRAFGGLAEAGRGAGH